MGVLKGLLGMARRGSDLLTEEEIARREAERLRFMEHEQGGSGPELQSLFDEVLYPKPTREREAALMQRINDLTGTEKRHPWYLGGAGYGGYLLGKRDKDEK